MAGTPKLTVIQGLGYDHSRDDYKVIWAIKRIQDLEFSPTRTYVFSSVSSCWKRIGDFAYKRISNFAYNSMGAASTGVVFKGSPHWIVSRIQGGTRVIVYFDSREETFRELPIPVPGLRLVVLGGNLCGVDDNADNSIDVWVLKDLTWSLMFVVPHGLGEFSARVITPLFFTCQVVVIQLNARALALYNVEENRYEKIELPRDCERFGAACYVETLAAP